MDEVQNFFKDKHGIDDFKDWFFQNFKDYNLQIVQVAFKAWVESRASSLFNIHWRN